MNEQTNKKSVVIFGGTGFVGSEIARQAHGAGYQPVIVTRNPKPDESSEYAKHFEYKICDYTRQDNLEAVLEGAHAAINCVGVLYETKDAKFEDVHLQLPHNIAKAAATLGVRKFIQISSLGVHAPSDYGRSKKHGEIAISKKYEKVIILRPSVIFGPDDDFFNMFNKLSKFLPVLPLIGGGHTKMQPVYVGDVAKAAINALTDPAAEGQVYELGGAETLSFKEIYQRLFKITKRKRFLLPLNWQLSYMQAKLFQLLPKPLLTVDQVKSLTVDNVVTDGAKTLKDLGLQPTPLDPVLEQYLR